MDISIHKQKKQVRLKQFLKILSADPSLYYQDGQQELRSLPELLRFTGYLPGNESVDMAELVSLLLKKRGLEVGSEDMMEYIMNGGTVDGFMNIGRQEAT